MAMQNALTANKAMVFGCPHARKKSAFCRLNAKNKTANAADHTMRCANSWPAPIGAWLSGYQ